MASSSMKICRICRELRVDYYNDDGEIEQTMECKCRNNHEMKIIPKEELDKIMSDTVKKCIKEYYEKRMAKNETDNSSIN